MNKIRLLGLLSLFCASSVVLSGCGGGGETQPQLGNEPPATTSHRDFGNYRIHFNALSTDSLAPQVAQAYGIVRSASRAMLNVTIVERTPEGPGKPIEGVVSVNASNLTGQLKVINLRQIVEGEGDNRAIYYIGEMPVTDGETLIFDIIVTPEGAPSNYKIRFQKQFFTS